VARNPIEESAADTRARVALTALFVPIFGAACASSGTATAAPGTAALASSVSTAGAPSSPVACASAATQAEEVLIANFEYQPASLTVPVGSGVAWTNTDAEAHTVTFDGGPECGRMERDASVALDFDTVGTFSYFCAFHPDMRGEVIVE
jgi:plastocyanin